MSERRSLEQPTPAFNRRIFGVGAIGVAAAVFVGKLKVEESTLRDPEVWRTGEGTIMSRLDSGLVLLLDSGDSTLPSADESREALEQISPQLTIRTNGAEQLVGSEELRHPEEQAHESVVRSIIDSSVLSLADLDETGRVDEQREEAARAVLLSWTALINRGVSREELAGILKEYSALKQDQAQTEAYNQRLEGLLVEMIKSQEIAQGDVLRLQGASYRSR